MTIKSILCVTNTARCEVYAIKATLELANIFGAHIRFLLISHDPSYCIDSSGVKLFKNNEQILDEERKIKASIEKTKRGIILLMTKYDIPIETKEYVKHHASAHFIYKSGCPDAIITKEGMASDIIVLDHKVKNENLLYDFNLISALFSTGRPVLFLPAHVEEKSKNIWEDEGSSSLDSSVECSREARNWRDETITIAWDGSLESARAIFYSMPILERAEKLYIITASTNGNMDGLEPQEPIIDYLLAHNLKPNHIILNCKSNAAETILAKAKELNTDLLVMGAYGHSRLYEVILGGFTKYMLEKAEVSLLLVH